MRDNRLWLTIAAALFASVAWPIALVDLPPLQDLPNHLATADIIRHLDRYPEYAFNGFFKTNTGLFLWLHLTAGVLGLKCAAKAFVLLVLATTSLVLPRLVLEIGGRARMITAAFFAWPMIHNWFVSMGMLDYALGASLGLLVVLLFVRQARAPTTNRAIVIAALSILLWLVHAFALAVVGLLALVHVVVSDDRRKAFRWVALPIAPAVPFFAWSIVQQLDYGSTSDVVQKSWFWVPPWELVYNMWSEFLWGFTFVSASSLVVALGLAIVVFATREDDVPIFSRAAFVVLGALYFFGPYHATHWFYVTARFLPFLWAAALVRVPERLPRSVAGVLAAAWLAYASGMGFDYIRLDRAWNRFARGTSVVPEGARLLPLTFEYKETSINTRNMQHAWGLYAIERSLHVPLVFAHSRSFPITLRTPPPPAFHQLRLEAFPRTMRGPKQLCMALGVGMELDPSCDDLYARRWRDFWDAAIPEYPWVLAYAMPDDARRLVPADYELAYREGLVEIYRLKR